MEYKSLRVRVQITVANRVATVVPQPSVACLLIKALKEPPRDRKKEKNIKHHGNLTLDQIVEIARKQRSKSLAKELSGTVLEILGTCKSMGCTIEGVSAKEMTMKIKGGEVSIPVKPWKFLLAGLNHHFIGQVISQPASRIQ